MKYIIRINRRAYNPITGKLIPGKIWEIEQCATPENEKVLWHCAEIRIGTESIAKFFTMPKPGDPPFELVIFGLAARAHDDAIVILRGKHDV